MKAGLGKKPGDRGSFKQRLLFLSLAFITGRIRPKKAVTEAIRSTGAAYR